MSWQPGRGVLNVAGIIRRGLSKFPHLDPNQEVLRSLESGSGDVGDIYRKMMDMLIRSRSREDADGLIRDAVLNAWQSSTPPAGPGLSEDELASWQLTDGLVSLADFVANNPTALRTIVTTNFDPLIEVALRRVGVKTRRQVITADRPIVLDSDGDPDSDGVVTIIYVHGFWWQAPTMHTEAQLTSSRLRLTFALSRLIEGTDILVIGYGGWDDVVTQSLQNLALDDGATGEVMWCFYETDDDVIRARHRVLLSRVQRLVAEGLMQNYAGIDCHRFFQSVGNRNVQTRPDGIVDATVLPTHGWVHVDGPLIHSAAMLVSDQDLATFFDGRAPDWGTVTSPKIPALKPVTRLLDEINADPRDRASLHVLLAAAGDGKTTALLQTAVALHQRGLKVVWRPHSGVPVPVEALLETFAEQSVVFVIDEIDGCLGEVDRLLTDPRASGFLVLGAARLADWRNAGGDSLNFESVKVSRHTIRALSNSEALALVSSWETVPGGLAILQSTAPGERAQKLLEVVAADRSTNGSLLGGLFRLRFDSSGLDSHVNEMMDTLERYEIEDSHVSLLKSFLYVCAIEVAGVEGIDRRLWAELMGVDVKSLRRLVEFRLGTEAATSRAGGRVETRHPEIARSAVRLLKTRSRGLAVAELFGDIVFYTIALGRSIQLRNYSETVHSPTRLPSALIDLGYSQREAVDIAVHASRRAVDQAGNLLVYRTDLGSIQRRNGRAEDAIATYVDAERVWSFFRDSDWAAAGFYQDWAYAYLDNSEPTIALATTLRCFGSETARMSLADFEGRVALLARCLHDCARKTPGARQRLALGGLMRAVDLAMVSRRTHDYVLQKAKDGFAPKTDTLDGDQAIHLVEAGVRSILSGSAGEHTLGDGGLSALEAVLHRFVRGASA